MIQEFGGTTIDVLRPHDQHDRQLFRRKRKKLIEGNYCWLVSPEDFILQKLKVGRPRDFEDAVSVLARSVKKLNRRYLQRWAAKLGISAELHCIFSL